VKKLRSIYIQDKTMKLEKITISSLAMMIDHSLLHPALTEKDLESGCKVAHNWETATVCVKPYAVSSAKDLLLGSPVRVTTVVSFPHGNSSMNTKIRETVIQQYIIQKFKKNML
jgi:deoxyribose-phosphate aldolase